MGLLAQDLIRNWGYTQIWSSPEEKESLITPEGCYPKKPLWTVFPQVSYLYLSSNFSLHTLNYAFGLATNSAQCKFLSIASAEHCCCCTTAHTSNLAGALHCNSHFARTQNTITWSKILLLPLLGADVPLRSSVQKWWRNPHPSVHSELSKITFGKGPLTYFQYNEGFYCQYFFQSCCENFKTEEPGSGGGGIPRHSPHGGEDTHLFVSSTHQRTTR